MVGADEFVGLRLRCIIKGVVVGAQPEAEIGYTAVSVTDVVIDDVAMSVGDAIVLTIGFRVLLLCLAFHDVEEFKEFNESFFLLMCSCSKLSVTVSGLCSFIVAFLLLLNESS